MEQIFYEHLYHISKFSIKIETACVKTETLTCSSLNALRFLDMCLSSSFLNCA